MDTREKIIPLESIPKVLGNAEWLIVVGLFDPLTAVQARRVAEFRDDGARKLLTVVLSGEETLLPANARAALVAGLREVDAVTIAEGEQWRVVLENRANVELIEDPEGERARTDEFVQFVIARQNV